jgi:hypothetical protein
LSHLRELWLQQTHVSDTGLVHLATLRHAEVINLEGTRATARGVAKLIDEMPSTRIVR